MNQNSHIPVSGASPDQLSHAFRHTFRHHPAGVVILTAQGSNGPIALTVSSLISVNASPPIVAFSLSSGSRTSAEFLEAETVVIHFLSRSDKALGILCATAGSERFGKAANWERLPTGEPRYSNVQTWFRARLTNRLCVDGATLVTAEVVQAQVAPKGCGGDPLVYFDRAWHGLNSEDESPLAATYPCPMTSALGAWRFWA